MRIIDDENPPMLKKIFRRGEKFAVNGILFLVCDVSNRQLTARAIGRYERNRIVMPSSRLFGPDGRPIKHA